MGYQPINETLNIELHATLSSATTPPNRLRTEFYGDIYLDGGHEDEPCVGYVTAFTVDLKQALGAGKTASDVFDSDSRTSRFAEVLDSGVNGVDDDHPFTGLFDDPPHPFASSAFLILDRMEIVARYRGNGIGLDVVDTMCAHLGAGCAYAMLCAFPFQHERQTPDVAEGEIGPEENSDGDATAHCHSPTEKLVSYYERVDFALVPNTDGIMVRAMKQ